MPVDHREMAFEAAIEHDLLTRGGYAKGDNSEYHPTATDDRYSPEGFDQERALCPGVFVGFVKEMQPETWQVLEKLHGTNAEAVVLDDLTKALDGQAGVLAVIRHGFKCFGKLIRVAFFTPAHGMNPDTQRLYQGESAAADEPWVGRPSYHGQAERTEGDLIAPDT
jgi:type I restriction enzyme R subunit